MPWCWDAAASWRGRPLAAGAQILEIVRHYGEQKGKGKTNSPVYQTTSTAPPHPPWLSCPLSEPKLRKWDVCILRYLPDQKAGDVNVGILWAVVSSLGPLVKTCCVCAMHGCVSTPFQTVLTAEALLELIENSGILP